MSGGEKSGGKKSLNQKYTTVIIFSGTLEISAYNLIYDSLQLKFVYFVKYFVINEYFALIYNSLT